MFTHTFWEQAMNLGAGPTGFAAGWEAETGSSDRPLIDEVLAKALSDFLADAKNGTQGLVTEVFVMDNKHSESNEYIHRMTNEVEDRVHQIQEEMMLNRTEHERIIGEYRNAKHLLHQFDILNLDASSRNYPLPPGSAANLEVTDPDEDNAEIDPDHILPERGQQDAVRV